MGTEDHYELQLGIEFLSSFATVILVSWSLLWLAGGWRSRWFVILGAYATSLAAVWFMPVVLYRWFWPDVWLITYGCVFLILICIGALDFAWRRIDRRSASPWVRSAFRASALLATILVSFGLVRLSATQYETLVRQRQVFYGRLETLIDNKFHSADLRVAVKRSFPDQYNAMLRSYRESLRIPIDHQADIREVLGAIPDRFMQETLALMKSHSDDLAHAPDDDLMRVVQARRTYLHMFQSNAQTCADAGAMMSGSFRPPSRSEDPAWYAPATDATVKASTSLVASVVYATRNGIDHRQVRSPEGLGTAREPLALKLIRTLNPASRALLRNPVLLEVATARQRCDFFIGIVDAEADLPPTQAAQAFAFDVLHSFTPRNTL